MAISRTLYSILPKNKYRKRQDDSSWRFIVCIANKYLLVRYVGEKCHLSCSLDSYVELSLMESASTGYTSGEDLSSLGDELSELSYVLVINAVNLVLAEDANLLSSVHGTEVGAGRIVSFHLDSQTFLTHDFYIASVTVSRVTDGRVSSL